MRLKTLTPAGIIVDEQIARIRFDALDGSFTFLPKHADFVTVIVPGLVSFEPLDEKNPGHEVYMACDSGVLVKDNTTVLLSVRRAVISENLEELSRTITEEFKKDEEIGFIEFYCQNNLIFREKVYTIIGMEKN